MSIFTENDGSTVVVRDYDGSTSLKAHIAMRCMEDIIVNLNKQIKDCFDEMSLYQLKDRMLCVQIEYNKLLKLLSYKMLEDSLKEYAAIHSDDSSKIGD